MPYGSSHLSGLNTATRVSKKTSVPSSSVSSQVSNVQPAFFANLSANKYSQLMDMLQSHLKVVQPETTKPVVSHVAGTRFKVYLRLLAKKFQLSDN